MTHPRAWRSIALAACLTIVTTLLAGCGSGSTEESSDGPVVLSLWANFEESGTPADWAALMAMVDKFNTENPEVQIEATGYPNLEYQNVILPTAFASDDLPDIFLHVGFDKLFQLQERTLDVTQQYKDGWSERYVDGIDTLVSDEGRYLGVPWTVNSASFLFYNNDQLSAVGLDPTAFTTFASWEAANDTALAAGTQPFAFSGEWWFTVHMATNFIEREIGPDKTTALAYGEGDWTDDGVKRAFTRMNKWYKKGYLGQGTVDEKYNVALQQFHDGDSMAIGFNDGITNDGVSNSMAEMQQGKPFDFMQVPLLEGGNGDPGSFIYYGTTVSATKGDHEEKKLAVLDAFGSAEYQKVSMEDSLRIPAAIGATEGLELPWVVDKKIELYADSTRLVPILDLTVPTDTINAMQELFPAMISGAIPIDEGLQRMQDVHQASLGAAR